MESIVKSIFDRVASILPLQGRWQGAALTEGCNRGERGTPLHHWLRQRSPSPYRGGFIGALFASLFLIATPAQAERVKDLGTFQGVRPNQLLSLIHI